MKVSKKNLLSFLFSSLLLSEALFSQSPSVQIALEKKGGDQSWKKYRNFPPSTYHPPFQGGHPDIGNPLVPFELQNKGDFMNKPRDFLNKPQPQKNPSVE